MKVLVVSDSHGRVGNVLDAVELELPDYVFHLGDLCRDVEDLRFLDPMLPVCTVVGNCDGWNSGEEEREFSLGGVKCLLTHGHLYHAKAGVWGLVKAGTERGVDVVFFGHTHQPVMERQPNGLWLVNPGTVGGIHNKATYAVAEIQDGQMSVQIKEL